MKPYNYVRFAWYKRVDLEALKEALSEFTVIDRPWPYGEFDLSLYQDEREGLQCKADNLSAFLQPFKAVLYQKTQAPFTRRDLRLREIVMESYPRERSTMLTIGYPGEPDFEVADDQKRR